MDHLVSAGTMRTSARSSKIVRGSFGSFVNASSLHQGAGSILDARAVSNGLGPTEPSCCSDLGIRRMGRTICYNLERILPNRTGAFDGGVSSRFRDQRLQAFELAAPDRLHVPITARIPRLVGISNTDGSHLHDVRLRSARKLDPVPRIRRLSESHLGSTLTRAAHPYATYRDRPCKGRGSVHGRR